MQERDRFADAVLRDEMRRLNSHLPTNRRTLEELLADPSPSVESVSGHSIRMKKEQLEELSKSLPENSAKRIRLPIMFLRRRDLGPGAHVVLGDPFEEYATRLLTGGFHGTFEEFKKQHQSVGTFYKPEISLLLRRFHSLVVIGFAASSD